MPIVFLRKIAMNQIDDTDIIVFDPPREAPLYQEPHLMCTWSLFALATYEAAYTSNFVHHHFILYLLAVIPVAFVFVYPVYQLLNKYLPTQDPLSLDRKLMQIKLANERFRAIKSNILFWRTFYDSRIWAPLITAEELKKRRRKTYGAGSFSSLALAILIPLTTATTIFFSNYLESMGVSYYIIFCINAVASIGVVLITNYVLFWINRHWF